jgi:hypothetical protein
MSFPLMKTSLAAALALALSVGSAAAADPTPAALGYAATIVNDIGVKPMLDRIVPAMLAELQRQVLATRPELKDPLGEAVQTVTPEFVKSEQAVLDDVAKSLASQMTEQELKDTAAFYESPTGKKFMAAQGQVAGEVARAAPAWRQQLSTDILTRVHEEMKKKGNDF